MAGKKTLSVPTFRWTKQRVALARALAMKPKVLGYDEPTSALDPALRQQVEEVIFRFTETRHDTDCRDPRYGFR